MKRGDVITVAASGDFGKPRQAVIVQSDAISPDHGTVIICQMTSDLDDLPDMRVTVEPSTKNGLRVRSQIMADKPTTILKKRIGTRIGSLEDGSLRRLDRALSLALGLLD